MIRSRLIMVCVFAAMAAGALGGVGASSASAAFVLTEKACTGTPKTVTLCYVAKAETEALLELSGTETFKGELQAGEETLLAATLGGEKVHITCTVANASGTITQSKPLEEPPTISKTTITFEKCLTLPNEPPKCDVQEPIVVEEISGIISNATQIQFRSELATGIWAEIAFVNNGTEVCPETIAGKQPINGTQLATWSTPTQDLAVQLLETVEKSLLKEGANAAELKLPLNMTFPGISPDLWDIVEA